MEAFVNFLRDVRAKQDVDNHPGVAVQQEDVLPRFQFLKLELQKVINGDYGSSLDVKLEVLESTRSWAKELTRHAGNILLNKVAFKECLFAM